MDLEKIFLELHRPIYGYVFLRVQNKEAAEDITQEIFMKAWRSRDTFDSAKASLKSWLFKIAINTIYDYFKKNKNKTISLEENLKLVENLEDTENVPQKKEEIDFAYKKMQKLSAREQELLLLRFKEDLKIKEIARILNMGISAVKVALGRALKKLTDLCNEDL